MPLGDYVTTEDSCSCPAFMYRPGPCKHIDQVREVTEHLKQQGEVVKVSPRTLPDGSWGVAVNGGRVQVGQTVTVESNNGKTWSAVITQIAEDHPTHQLCATCKPEEWTGAPPAPAQAAPAPVPAQTTPAPLYPPETPAQARQPQRPKGGDKPDRAAPGEDQVWDPVPEVQKNMVYGYRWGYWAGRRDGLDAGQSGMRNDLLYMLKSLMDPLFGEGSTDAAFSGAAPAAQQQAPAPTPAPTNGAPTSGPEMVAFAEWCKDSMISMGDVKHATGLTAMNETTLVSFLSQHGKTWEQLKTVHAPVQGEPGCSMTGTYLRSKLQDKTTPQVPVETRRTSLLLS